MVNPKITDFTPDHPPKVKRQHRGTYASDNRKGGYLVRVVGPHASSFLGKDVTVTKKNGDEHVETLTKLIWSDKDKETGEPVALYHFASKPYDSTPIEF